MEYVANLSPGPGNYYPRVRILIFLAKYWLHFTTQLEIPKIKEAKPNREDFKKKMKESQKKAGKQPDGFHYNPFPATFDTFGKLHADIEAKKPGTLKPRSLSNEKRWIDPKKEKAKAALMPGPGEYPLIAQWPGKLEKGMKKDENKKKNWMNLITKGVEKSIYHD